MIKNKIRLIILVLLTQIFFCLDVNAGGRRPVSLPLIARKVNSSNYVKSPDDMIVTFIDVGQGNSILVQSPTGVVMLFDSGGSPEWMKSPKDIGMDIVVPYIESVGIEKIDYAVMSHAHGDHIGGYRSVLYCFNIGKFLDPGFLFTTDIYKNLLKTVKSRKIKYDIIKEEDDGKIDFGDLIETFIFSPPKDGFLKGTNSDVNNSSVLIKIKYGEVSFLFTGDLENEGELRCVQKYGNKLESNILQVCHHGSFTSSSKAFLNKVLPEVAIIPVGKYNTYGHPRPETLSNLESIGAEIYRTDLDGNIVVYTDGKTFIVETNK